MLSAYFICKVVKVAVMKWLMKLLCFYVSAHRKTAVSQLYLTGLFVTLRECVGESDKQCLTHSVGRTVIAVVVLLIQIY